MTVSPQWPDEGSRPPHYEGNGVKSNDIHRPNALPPTLFQLPNLNADRTGSAGANLNPGSTEGMEAAATAETKNSVLVGQVPFVSAVPTARGETPSSDSARDLSDRSGFGKMTDRDSDEEPPTFPTPPAVVDSTRTPATIAGRNDSG